MKNTKYYTVLEFFLLLSIVSAVFLVDLKQTKFFGDEATWIQRSSHFEDFFTGNFSAFHPKTQRDKYLELTMPTIPEYIIGLSRRMGGYDAQQVKKIKPITSEKAYEQTSNYPPIDMLWWSRLLPTLLSIASTLLMFYLIKVSFNTLAGYIWMILTLINTWLINTLQRAMAESPLLFFIVLTILAGFLAIKSFKDNAKSIRYSLLWLVAFGIFTGLAGQSKSNGLTMFPAGIVILLLLTMRCQNGLRWRFFFLGLAGLTIATAVFFVVPDPLLWNDPIRRTILVFQYRVKVMHGSQAESNPRRIIKSWEEGVQIAFNQIFSDSTPIQFAGANYLKMILAGIGFTAFVSQIWRKSETMNAGALSILIVGLFISIPSLFTYLNIQRYYFPPVYFASILIAVGAERLLSYAMYRIKRPKRFTPPSEA